MVTSLVEQYRILVNLSRLIHTVRLLRFMLGIVAAVYFFSTAAELSAASPNPSETSAPTESLSIGGAAIHVEIEPGDLNLSRIRILDWVKRSASAVSEYYAGFPIRNVNVKIVPIAEGKGVLFGRTVLVDQIPLIRVGLSSFATDSSLRDDWVMTHEMVHLAFPSVPDEHHWIEEGIATYVEPIARAQVGDLSAEIVWRELVDGLPKGLPASSDRGLDNTHTWGRTYWGGALFCLMADVEITGAPTIDTDSRMLCGGLSAPAATWTTTGRSFEL